jgi:hypothetical protein
LNFVLLFWILYCCFLFCKILSLRLKDTHVLKVFQNTVLRKVLDPRGTG